MDKECNEVINCIQRSQQLPQYPKWRQPLLRQIKKLVIIWKVYKLETQFFSRPKVSRVRNSMKISFAFYGNSNYLKSQNGRYLGQNWRFETKHLFPRHYTLVVATNWRTPPLRCTLREPAITRVNLYPIQHMKPFLGLKSFNPISCSL